MTPGISVVVPCHNAAPFLGETLGALHGQTRRPDEVIVVDDHSADGSAAVARQSGVQLISLDATTGPAAARNAGASASRYDTLLFLDADDLVSANFVSALTSAIDRHGDDVVAFSRVRTFGASSHVWPAVLPHDTPSDILPFLVTNCPCTAATAMRRAVLLDAGGFDEARAVSEDYDLWLRLSDNCRFVQLHDTWLDYRRHDTQLTRRNRSFLVSNYEIRLRAQRRVVEKLGHPAAATTQRTLNSQFLADIQAAWYRRDVSIARQFLAKRKQFSTLAWSDLWSWNLRSRVPGAVVRLIDRLRHNVHGHDY